MADVEGLDDDRDTCLPPSALSPAEYRGFRALLKNQQLQNHRDTGEQNAVSLNSILDFLASFNAVSYSVAQQIVDIVLEGDRSEFVGEGHIYAMIRLIGHWQTDRRIEKSLIFVQARVPDRFKSDHEGSSTTISSVPPTSTTLNPFRANSIKAPSSTLTRSEDVGRGVEAFKRLMLANNNNNNNKDSSSSTAAESTDLAPALKDETSSLQSHRTEQSTTGMTFVYSSDEEEDDVGSATKHSPETLMRESPQPMISTSTAGSGVEKRLLPPLIIPSQGSSSSVKPAPPPSRKRGASGSNQNSNSSEEKKIADDKTSSTVRRSLPPAPPAPRRSPSSASTQRLERASSIRKDLPPPPPPPLPSTVDPSLSSTAGTTSSSSSSSNVKPPPPRPRRKLSDTSVTSFDINPPPPARSDPDPSPNQTTTTTTTTSKRLSVPPPPPPPPRHSTRKFPSTADPQPTSPTRRSTEIPLPSPSLDGSPTRRSSAPDQPKPKSTDLSPIPDSELSLELGRLQREVDELVFGLTKKSRGKKSHG